MMLPRSLGKPSYYRETSVLFTSASFSSSLCSRRPFQYRIAGNDALKNARATCSTQHAHQTTFLCISASSTRGKC